MVLVRFEPNTEEAVNHAFLGVPRGFKELVCGEHAVLMCGVSMSYEVWEEGSKPQTPRMLIFFLPSPKEDRFDQKNLGWFISERGALFSVAEMD